IVSGGVVAEPIRQGLDDCWALSAAGSVQSLRNNVPDRDDIVAIDLHAGDAGGDGFLSQRAGGSLALDGYRDGPPVVDHDKHCREGAGAGQIDSFIEGAFGGAAVAHISHGATRLAPDLECHGDSRAMQHLGGDRYAPGEVLPRHAEIAAALVATPVDENL